MNKNRMEKIIFVLLLLTMIIICYYKFVMSTQLETIKSTRADVKKLEQDLQTIYKFRDNRDKNEEKLMNMKKELEKINVKIPNQSNSNDFKYELYKYLKNKGIKLNNLATQNKQKIKSKNCTREIININIKDTKEKIMNFIKYLQEHKRKIKIQEVGINIVSTEEIGVRIKINIYSMNK